jgi:hypothetical protein
MPNPCTYNECKKNAQYNYNGETIPIYCKEHMLEGMRHMFYKRCEYVQGCNTTAIYNYPGEKAKYCKTHKEENMIDVKRPKCKEIECLNNAYYGIYGNKAEYCSIHKKDDMINLTVLCVSKGCTIVRSFNYPNLKTAKFCATHKLEGMIDITVNRCTFPGCNTVANFDIPDGKGSRCSKHKELGMIDITHPTCVNEECNNHPVYNFEGMKARYCNDHKLEGMINLKSKVCIHENCKKSASFNYADNPPRYCAEHKLENMINTKNTKCELCNISASYGKPGNKVSRCVSHREKGMIKSPTSKCKNCKNPAIYGINLKPLHCEAHKHDNEINYLENECSSCGLLSVLDKDNKCEYCNPEIIRKAILQKQKALFDYLDMKVLKGVSDDSVVQGGVCGKERPDRVYETDKYVIILECDEHQHKDRNCECEQTRMINIAQSYGGIPVYFIRWNPDVYKPVSGKSEEGIKDRYNVLGNYLKKLINYNIELPHSLVSVFYMYYDGWGGIENEKWTPLIEFEKGA